MIGEQIPIARWEMATLDWPGTLVETDWLEAHLGHPELRIIDIRGEVKSVVTEDGKRKTEYSAARGDYDAGHIPGAQFVDWTKEFIDLDDPIPVQIAPPESFAAAMSAIGVGDETAVVIYDNQGRAFSTRLWWALTYYGHERVAIVNGGWAKWAAEQRPVTTEVQSPTEQPTFTPKAGRLGRKTGQEVLEHVQLGDAVLVDALRREQYTGEEPRGGEARGHIPGALSLPYLDLYTPQDTWKSDEELRATIAEAGLGDDERPVVAYCGGGVSATAVLFALDRLGRHGHNYDGSWNEWGNNPQFPTREGAVP
jgi:thiosulfate/3-mercaptopyruvate sulfurtransferase